MGSIAKLGHIAMALHNKAATVMTISAGIAAAVTLAVLLRRASVFYRRRRNTSPPPSVASPAVQAAPDDTRISAEPGDDNSRLVVKPLSRRTKAIAGMATALSLDGMYTVFSATLHFPWIATVAACGTLDAAGYEFAHQTREERLADRPGTWQLVATWITVLTSGSLSATAALVTKHSNRSIIYYPVLESVVRFILPVIAMLLVLSWMLPKVVEVSLTKRQEARWAWAYYRTQLFEQRATWWLTKWMGEVAHRWARDRIAHRSLQRGDVGVVYKRAARQALRAMLADFDEPAGASLEDFGLESDSATSGDVPDAVSESLHRTDIDGATGQAIDPGASSDRTLTGHEAESGSDLSGQQRPDERAGDRTPDQTGRDPESDSGSGAETSIGKDAADLRRRTPRSASRSADSPPGSGSADTGKLKRGRPVEELESVCREWAQRHGRDPQGLIRMEIQSILKNAGYSCSTDRAQTVQGLLDPVLVTEEMAQLSGHD